MPASSSRASQGDSRLAGGGAAAGVGTADAPAAGSREAGGESSSPPVHHRRTRSIGFIIGYPHRPAALTARARHGPERPARTRLVFGLPPSADLLVRVPPSD